MTKPYPDYQCLYRCYSLVAQNPGVTYLEVAERIDASGLWHVSRRVE